MKMDLNFYPKMQIFPNKNSAVKHVIEKEN